MLNTDAVHVWRETDGQHHVEWQASDPDTRVVVELLEPSLKVSANYDGCLLYTSDAADE